MLSKSTSSGTISGRCECQFDEKLLLKYAQYYCLQLICEEEIAGGNFPSSAKISIQTHKFLSELQEFPSN